MTKITFLLLIMSVLIAGCATDQTDPEAPAKAIEAYLETRISKDSDIFSGTYCADFEATAITEFDSFGAVEATLEDMVCTVDSLDDGQATVTCAGNINVVYDGENNNTLDLARTPYSAVQEDGEWKMCGYAS